jgi:hypothetical protein
MSNPIPDGAEWLLDEFDADRFWSHVNRHGGTPYEADSLATASGECWLWNGGLGNDRYARFQLQGKWHPAHRIAYRDFGNRVEDRDVLDHLCRVKTCVNPAHLEAVSQLSNVDRGAIGRPANPACKHGHEYTDANTIWRKRGHYTYRICRTCQGGYKRTTYQRRKAAAAAA